MMSSPSITVLVANPSPDVYGSDLQLLDSISAMTDRGWRVVVVIPSDGRLVSKLRDRRAEVRLVDFPVVRRSNLSFKGVIRLIGSSPRSLIRMRRLIRSLNPDVLYVNTMTLPWWLLASRLAGVPSLCHVHEAEDKDGRAVLMALTAPLLLCNVVVANSKASVDAMRLVVSWLAPRIVLIYNGIAPPIEPAMPVVRDGGPFKLAAVCRLSPRKAPDVAMEAVALLRADGRDVTLDICGTAFEGYQWYVEELENRAAQDDLAGSVTFSGYVFPVWGVLERADAVVAPSLREPFGNAVVEAQLARRPVIASAALGHLETVIDGETGLLVTPGDPAALAAAVARLMDDNEFADRVAEQGRSRAVKEFSIERYHAEIVALIERLCRRRTGGATSCPPKD